MYKTRDINDDDWKNGGLISTRYADPSPVSSELPEEVDPSPVVTYPTEEVDPSPVVTVPPEVVDPSPVVTVPPEVVDPTDDPVEPSVYEEDDNGDISGGMGSGKFFGTGKDIGIGKTKSETKKPKGYEFFGYYYTFEHLIAAIGGTVLGGIIGYKYGNVNLGIVSGLVIGLSTSLTIKKPEKK